MTNTVIVALHDGWYGCGTGAGRSNRIFLTGLLPLLAPPVRLRVLPIRLEPDSQEYDPAWHATSQAILRNVDEVVPVDNGTNGQIRFGNITNFQHACTHAAQIITGLVDETETALVVAIDAPFAGLAPRLPHALRSRLVYVPRSTALLHSPDDAGRVAFDHEGFQALTSAGGRVAAVSPHMRDHLQRAFSLPDRSLIDLPNGLAADDWNLNEAGPYLLPSGARSRFLFALGRAQPYKGFDDLLDALGHLRERRRGVPHLVLAAVTESAQPSPYQQHLAKRIRDGQLDATLITRFDHRLRGLFAHSQLAAAIIPSRTEPFGRVLLDAYIGGGAPVVTTTAGGLATMAHDKTHDKTAFTCQPSNPASLAAAIDRALDATPAQRARMRRAARAEAARHAHPDAVHRFLHQTAPWALAHGEPFPRRTHTPGSRERDQLNPRTQPSRPADAPVAPTRPPQSAPPYPSALPQVRPTPRSAPHQSVTSDTADTRPHHPDQADASETP